MFIYLAGSEPVESVLGIFYPGEAASFLLVLVLGLLLFNYVNRARKGLEIPSIRRMPGLDAIDEAIGRATEMGKPVLYGVGRGDVTAPDTLATMPLLEHVTMRCAAYDTDIIQVNAKFVVYGIADEVVRQAYLRADKPDLYNPDNVRWYTDSQYGFAAATAATMRRELPAANLMFGHYMAESIIIGETGASLEMMQVGGTTNVLQIPFLVATCDYTLLAEEFHAASAYVSQDPPLVASIAALDQVKVALVILMVIGSILATFDSHDWLVELFHY